MSYTSVDELPTEVRRALSLDDARIWMDTYNSTFEEISSVQDCNVDPHFCARECAWEMCKTLPSSRYVMCNVSTAVIDKDRELADVDEYVLAGQDYVSAGGQVARNHSNKTIGTVWKVFKGIDAKSGKDCVIACVNFFRGKPTYDRAWNDFKTRKLEWSIGSIVHTERECNNTTCYNRLHPEQWFELSLVDFARNPITYNIEFNESAKGDAESDSYIEIHDEICPIMQKYNMLKEYMNEHSIESHIIESGTIMLVGKMDDDAHNYIHDQYSGYRHHHVETDEGESVCILFPNQIDETPEFLEAIFDLLKDEQEAISSYITVTKSLEIGEFLNDEQFEYVSKSLEEITRDEEQHVGVLLDIIKKVSPEMYSSIEEGLEENSEAEKGCPAGQHEHAGVVGCHDIFRKHSVDYKSNPMDKLDLTDENINVNSIKNTPTPKLRDIVVRIAKVLSRYDDKAVQDFMSHTAGKEFVLAYLELKRRQVLEGENKMSESEVKKDVQPADVGAQDAESDKGLLADPQTSIANIASILASLVPMLDGINARLLRVETSIASQNENKSDITSSILSDATLSGEQEGLGINPPQPTATEGVETKAMPATEEGLPADEGEDADKESDAPFPPKDKEGESEGEDKKEDSDDKEDSSESEDSDKKDEATEDEKKSEEKKPEPKKEDKDDEAKKGSSEEDVDKPVPEPTPEVVEVKGEEPVPVSTEVEKCDSTPVVTEVKGEEPAPVKEEPASVSEEPAPAPEPVIVKEMELPTPVGGNTVDFRARVSAVQKRQEELKAKGINYTVSSGTTSLAGSPNTYNSTNAGISLVQPTSTPSFNGIVGQPATSPQALWKDMGKFTPETFFNKLKGI